MQVALLADYYYPFDVSGAEISTRVLAGNLASHGTDTVVVTPDFGPRFAAMLNDGVKVLRFPFMHFKKVKPLPPIISSNPLWFIYAGFQIYRLLRKQPADILHVQNKNLVIPAFMANMLLRRKFLVTVRDYRLLCDLGICLMGGKEKACNWRDYFLKDMPFFIKVYKRPGIVTTIYSYLVGVYQLLLCRLQVFLLKHADKVICLSQSQERIYNNSGVKNTTFIYNQMQFSRLVEKRNKQVLFVGRYTLGKGKKVLEKVIPRFLEKHPDWEAVFVTRDKVGFNHQRLKIITYMPHEEFMKLMASVSICLIPSYWPEPLSRAALDALSVQTPVVASRMGSMAEIIEENKFGYLADFTTDSFMEALEKAVKNGRKLQKNIGDTKDALENKFVRRPVEKYLELYRFV